MKKILGTLNIDVIICRKAILDKAWNFKTCNFPLNRLYYIERGEGWVIHHERKFHLIPGKMYLIPAHTLVDYQFCPDHMIQYYVHFRAEVLNGLNLFSLIGTEFEREPAHSGDVERNFTRLMAIYNSTSPTDLIEADIIIRNLFLPFLSSSPARASEDKLLSRRFQELLAYIEDHLDQALTLKELAKVTCLHPTYLSNLFKSQFNVPLIKYCQRRRIEKARNLLWNTNLSMAEIAEQTGFREVFHFSKLFKSGTGIAPGKYRKMQKMNLI
jgi:AraC-like DNA-binding protein